ncbi:hypothetical protein NXV78_25835 [Bacteroides cellulosilyticus]|uniref:hypothetical protein n=1 Tax=Bacteroides cellulosilyticus TaxID=246787 RepID=UPI0021654781|nr:hypothetical protein [Bacteroides cellulosilyticus]MCS3057432.1 hypothetical protein [Bacteroides cellulosilyticus]
MASSGNSDNVNDDNKNDSGESGRSQYAPLSTIMGGIKILILTLKIRIMKFNIKIYIPVITLGLSLLLSGCGDSFLEKSPSDYITRRFTGSSEMEL